MTSKTKELLNSYRDEASILRQQAQEAKQRGQVRAAEIMSKRAEESARSAETLEMAHVQSVKDRWTGHTAN